MILVDRKETRTMEFQNCFKSKIILIGKEEFIGKFGKSDLNNAKKSVCGEVLKQMLLIWDFGCFHIKST